MTFIECINRPIRIIPRKNLTLYYFIKDQGIFPTNAMTSSLYFRSLELCIVMGWAGPGLQTFTECRLQQNVRPGFEPFVECQALGLEIILSKAVKKLKFSASQALGLSKKTRRIGLSQAPDPSLDLCSIVGLLLSLDKGRKDKKFFLCK